MGHLVGITIYYQNEFPAEYIQLIADKVITGAKMDVMNSDSVVHYDETPKEKSAFINVSVNTKDFKALVFDILCRFQKFSSKWITTGPVNVKGSLFYAETDRQLNPGLPVGINSIRVVLKKSSSF